MKKDVAAFDADRLIATYCNTIAMDQQHSDTAMKR